MLSYEEVQGPEDRRTEIEMALENLIDIQVQIERNVKWVLTDDPDLLQNFQAPRLYLSAINVAISNMIAYLEQKVKKEI
jgi:hypothetical protein